MTDRTEILQSLGATPAQIEELLAYNDNVFDHSGVKVRFPLPDELSVAAWERYAAEGNRIGVFACLQKYLVQLRFPIEAGISETEKYRAVTRRGATPPNDNLLELVRPEALQLVIHPTPSGRIPVLSTGHRADFVTLVQALLMKNEPGQVPPSMGACMVAGFNNWDRVHEYRQRFAGLLETHPLQKEHYQDRFIILSDGPYSHIPADQMGYDADEWKRLSYIIRREHECTHYFTRRVFDSMRNNLIDELMADYMGIVAAHGSYRADWFLRFMGLEDFPQYREGGRLQNYRGNLSDGAFDILKQLVKRAAENLAVFDQKYGAEIHPRLALMLMAMTYFTLEEFATEEITDPLRQQIQQVSAFQDYPA